MGTEYIPGTAAGIWRQDPISQAPIALGATLGIHPLAVLIVTIAGGSLFGTIGLVLPAPLTSAAVHIANELRQHSADPGLRVAEPEPVPSG